MHVAARLPKVKTRREFVRVLEDWTARTRDDGANGGRNPRARRSSDLKAYVLESNAPLRRRARIGRIGWSMADTGVSDLKILCVTLDGSAPVQFFMDISDRRFVTIHTNGRAADAERAVRALAEETRGVFDRMWLCHGMLDRIAKKVGGGLVGFALDYNDRLLSRAGAARGGPALEDMRIDVSGPVAGRLKDLMKGDRHFRNAMPYKKIRIMRGPQGDESGYVHDEIASAGRFAVKRGRSVRDHLGIVDESKAIYSRAVAEVEECRLGVADDGGGMSAAKGRPLVFTLPKRVADMDGFVGTLFSMARPFRLGGIASVVEPGYYRVLATDLHTRDPMTFEIARGMMRVYLSEHSSGNTVMRLLTNLQASYGTGVRCKDVDQVAA